MKFRWRRTFGFGPFRWHVANGRCTGWGLKVWRWRWSASTGKHSVDTPGLGGITFGRRDR